MKIIYEVDSFQMFAAGEMGASARRNFMALTPDQLVTIQEELVEPNYQDGIALADLEDLFANQTAAIAAQLGFGSWQDLLKANARNRPVRR